MTTFQYRPFNVILLQLPPNTEKKLIKKEWHGYRRRWYNITYTQPTKLYNGNNNKNENKESILHLYSSRYKTVKISSRSKKKFSFIRISFTYPFGSIEKQEEKIKVDSMSWTTKTLISVFVCLVLPMKMIWNVHAFIPFCSFRIQ